MAEGSAPAAGEALDALFGSGRPSHAAFVVPDDGQVLSYAEMAGRIETLAGRLSERPTAKPIGTRAAAARPRYVRRCAHSLRSSQ